MRTGGWVKKKNGKSLIVFIQFSGHFSVKKFKAKNKQFELNLINLST